MTSVNVRHGSDGKTAEAECRAVFDNFNNIDKHFTYHRYPDTKSASRGKVIHALASQPSDFLVGHQYVQGEHTHKRVWHFEVKETIKDKLTLGSLRQYPMLKKWWWAGIDPVVLVNRMTQGDWVLLLSHRLFPGQDAFIRDESVTPKTFSFEGLYGYPSAELALRDVFNFKKVKQ